ILKCFHRARGIVITSKNALAGWQATGLCRVNQSKSLLNHMTKKQSERPATPPKDVANQ
ncbi:hypothetical protein DER44DRAFT_680177, partial [Fusarium oxysporum]